MSIWIPNQNGTDLASAQIGSQAIVPFPMPERPMQLGPLKPTIVFNNESGCGLAITFNGSNRQVILPAGGWTDPIPLENQDTGITYYVTYILANAPVSKLYAVIYKADEKPLRITALGNSPIGISGNVNTSNIQSLTNDNNVPATSIIESTPNDQSTSAIQIFNDGSGFWKILSAGVLRTLLSIVRGNATTGHATVDIGDAADKTAFTFHGSIGSIHSDNQTISSDGAGNLTAVSFVGPLNGNANTATTVHQVDGTNAGSTTVPQIASATAGAGIVVSDNKAAATLNILPTENDATARTLQLNAITAAGAIVVGPHIAMDNPGFRYTGQLIDAATNDYVIGAGFTGTGAGTYNHNLKGGKTPTWFGITSNLANSTQTVGVDSATSTTIHANMPNAWAFYGIATLQ